MTDSSPHPDSPHPDVASAASAPGITYASSGVDTAAGDRAVELMKEAVAATHGPEVIGGIGAFAGLVDVSALKAYERPLLASSTDGVGTKIAIARAMDVHDTIGRDLVGMVVPVQARVNGELGRRLEDGLAAALLSFAGG